MAIHFLSPADQEPCVGCTLANSRSNPEWWELPLEKKRRVKNQEGKLVEITDKPRSQWLDSLTDADTIYAPLGGIGDALLYGAWQRGVSIKRTPFTTFHHREYRHEVEIPTKLDGVGPKQHERLVRAAQMVELVKAGEHDLFRDYLQVDAIIGSIRVLIGSILAIQDEIRKPLEQRMSRLGRDQEYLLMDGKGSPKSVHNLKVSFLQSADPVAELKKSEEELSRKIDKLLTKLPVWTEVLEPVCGIGPRLSGRIIGPIADIRRFGTLGGFRKYCGWAVILSKDGAYTTADKFRHGESAAFHAVVRQGFWLFEEQILKQKGCQFKYFYLKYKLEHQSQIGQVMYQRNGDTPVVMTKVWLHKRALRYAASRLVDYLYWMWWGLHGTKFYHSDTGELITQDDLLNPERYYGPLPASAENEEPEEGGEDTKS